MIFLSWLEIPLEFTTPLKETEIVEGANVTLEVQVSKPDAEVTWFKDDIQIAPDEHHKIVAEGTIRRLSIDRASIDDEAEYSVKVADKVTKAMLWVEGETSCQCSSITNAVPKIEFILEKLVYVNKN